MSVECRSTCVPHLWVHGTEVNLRRDRLKYRLNYIISFILHLLSFIHHPLQNKYLLYVSPPFITFDLGT